MDDVLAQLGAALQDRYTLERPLGMGGAATVHLAKDIRHARAVAIKVLRPEYTETVGRSRFLREIEIVAGLTHPHILPLHDSGSVGEICYFVMPYVEGETLRDRLDRETTLPLPDARRIALEVADAMAYAHSRGVVHRDLKPQNIMLEAGHAVVADFGIALSLGDADTTRLTRTGLAVGTPHYMSPEQASGTRSIDERTDLYSLGCILYEMLAGDPPFAGTNGRVVLARKLTGPAPDIRELRPSVGEALGSVVMRALEPEPADRYESAGAMKAALEGAGEIDVPAPAARVRADARERDEGRGALLPSRWIRNIGRGVVGAAGVTALMLLVGYLNTRAFDIKLQVPQRFTPSAPGYLTTGRHALTGLATFAGFFLLTGLLARTVGAFGVGAFRFVPYVGPRVTDTLHAVTRKAGARWRGVAPGARADLFFVICFVLSAIAVTRFAPLIYSVFLGDTALLACSHRNMHRAFTVILGFLAAALGFGWYRTFLDRPRAERTGRVHAAMWGSAAVILALVVIQSTPWQLLWRGSNPRVLIDGERGYVLVETPAELLVHNAERRRTEPRPVSPDNGIQPLNIAGYVFEEPEVFQSGLPECTAITNPPTGASP